MQDFLVQKFGGTSVGYPERLVSLKDIVLKYSSEITPILVVSAVSGSTKKEGTTSLLLESIESACKGAPYNELLRKIRSPHIRLIEEVIGSEGGQFISYLDSELSKLDSFLSAISTIGEKSSRSLDYVLSFGEKLSAALVEYVLKHFSVSARMVDLSVVFDSLEMQDYKNPYDEIAQKIVARIQPRKGEVCVCTGYFGYLSGGILSHVGRGYSDLTAALIARGLGSDKVKELQIWKEVDGVFTADPKRVPDARVLSEISAREAVELTFFGSEVIHPHTMEQVISKNIPIRVLNSLKPERSGTIIKRIVGGLLSK
ncbi:MAG: aspartate kinase [Ignavibacteria bacterium]|nr:aspartate kinase [Ignavibacteria bacterium]